MAKNWLSRLSLAAVIIDAAISTTSCSSDDDKDCGEWITPNNADVTVLYYSITLGCSTEALTFAPSLGSISTQGAIIVNPEGGSGTASDKYYKTVYLENGNAYFHEWLKGEAYDGKTFDRKSD